MKIMATLVMFCIFSLFSSGVLAQTLEDRLKTLEDTLRKQEQTIQELRLLKETLDKQEETINEQRKLIEALRAEVKLSQSPAASPGTVTAQGAVPEQMQQQVKELKEQVEEVVEAQKKTVPSVFNPSIGLVG